MIPNKWKVQITESNREVLEQWRLKQPNVNKTSYATCLHPLSLNKWLISDQNHDDTYMDWGYAEYYTEITFKQFILMENKPQFRPITMDCNQQQFDAIKPILEKHGFEFDRWVWDFTKWPYLTNNYSGYEKIIGNVSNRDTSYRPYGGQWNQELFLQCCGIVQQHNFQVEDKVRLKQGITKEQMLDMFTKTIVDFPSSMVADFNKALQDPKHEFVVKQVSSSENTMQLIYNNRIWYWPIEAFEPINKTEMKTYKVTIDQLKQIHDVACDTWKTKIKSLITDPFADHVELSQQQVDEMFKAAQDHQRPVLVDVFGEPKKHCPYKKGQLLWVWDNSYKYPSVRPFVEMGDDGKYRVNNQEGMGNVVWDNAAPFNNGQLPDQFKHLLNNQ